MGPSGCKCRKGRLRCGFAKSVFWAANLAEYQQSSLSLQPCHKGPSIFMAQIADGKKIAKEILEGLRLKIKDLTLRPKLAVFLAGENPASLSYVNIKQKRAEEIGVKVEIYRYTVEITEGKLIADIQKANDDPEVCGIIVQLPLSEHVEQEKILNAVDPALDVDCLTETNKQKSIKGSQFFLPPAVAAVMKIFDYYSIDLQDKEVLIVGSGELIGKPLASMLLQKNISFKIANRTTENFPDLVKNADVIITGAGKPKLITGDMVRDGVVVIDAGTAGSESGELSGDVDFESVSKKTSFITPVPGGVGPVTVAILLANVVKSAMLKAKSR